MRFRTREPVNVLPGAKELLNIGVGVFCGRMAVTTGKARLRAARWG